MNEVKAMHEVRLRSLGGTGDGGCVLLLEEINGKRLLPIYAGMAEGQAVVFHAKGITLPRPMTHDLLVSVIETLGARVARIEVHTIMNGVFIARLVLRKGELEIPVDARPSDAINIALRAKAPVLVAEEVFANVDLVLKPIATDEVERFKEQLDSVDPFAALDALEGKPAPKEASPEARKPSGDEGTPPEDE